MAYKHYPLIVRRTYHDGKKPGMFKNWINVNYYTSDKSVEIEWRANGKTSSKSIAEQIKFLEGCIGFLKGLEEELKGKPEVKK